MARVPTGRSLVLALASAVSFARAASAQLPPFEVVYQFEGTNQSPGPLVEASDGNFYGTTVRGGLYDRGTIFRMTRDYRVSTLHEFSGAFDGGYPVGKLLQASDGHLYGATYRNGAYDQGILYRITMDGDFRILHAFNLAVDGRYPTGSLVQGADGLLYGTTYGELCCAEPIDQGVAFRSTLDGDITVLHRFLGGTNDGAHPGPLIGAPDGNFYGKTRGGGINYLGTLFRVTHSGQFAVVHRFTEPMPSDSGNATSLTLALGADGSIYGNYGCDVGIFRFTLQNVFSRLTELGGDCSYSGPPSAELIAGAGGFLYATHSNGSIFVIGLNGVAGVVLSNQESGLHPTLMQSVNGHLYGSGGRRIVRVTPRPMAVPFSGTTSLLGTSVRVSWASVVNGASYTIRRREPGGSEIVIATGIQALSVVDHSVVRGVRYTYTVAAVNAFGEGVAFQTSIIAGRAAVGDFDGDGDSDPAIFRPASGEWHIRGAADVIAWGGQGDVPVAADYTGDGITDIAVFRPSTGTWYIRGFGSVAWGGPGDIPVPAYYRGGTAVDIAVFRPSTGTWHIRGLGAIAWGGAGDTPAPGDYDGDGRADVAIYRATDAHNPTDGWYVLYSAGGGTFLGSCCPAQMAPGDYNGDGTTDLGLFSNTFGEWIAYRPSGSRALYARWGGVGDTSAAADYDGDGLTDVAVFRESTGDWYILLTGPRTGVQFKWGGPGDIPIQKAP